MKLTGRTPLGTVAAAVGDALLRAGIDAVLTGGACACIFSEGRYQSHDVDFVLRSAVDRRKLDEAMSALGFLRKGDRYVHPETPFYVEFPAGPLAIGSDAKIAPVERRHGALTFQSLDATDAARDRLAAWLFWGDLQAFDAAVLIARRHEVDLVRLRRWLRAEGRSEDFAIFRKAV